ncbi:MAG: class C sortase [Lachnospiraceae bacterium]|nr:class C sortase [Lachnospiraceae bacterium]
MGADREPEKQQKEKSGSRVNVRTLLGMLIFVFGLCVILYPAVSDRWNQWRQSRLTQNYEQTVEQLQEDDVSELWEAAWEYNANLTGNTIGDAFEGIALTETEGLTASEAAAESEDTSGADLVSDTSDMAAEADAEYETEEVLSASKADTLYQSLLNPAGDGIMGYLSIPKIDVYLPIYHGTDAEELQKGVGHLYGTSLPAGGEGTHTVLAGHRGLPSAALLTDLDYLEEGDLLYLYILDDVLAYEVTGVEVVEPDETDSLAIQAGEDLITIVTCTPYGINTHRLLVHGSRVEYVPEEEQETVTQVLDLHSFAWMAYGLPAIGIAFVLLLALLMRVRRKRRERRNQE